MMCYFFVLYDYFFHSWTWINGINFCFFSERFIRVQVMQPYSRTDTAPAWKRSCFISLERSYFHRVVYLSVAVHVSPIHTLISLLIDKILLPRYCGDLGINNKTPNRMLTRRLPHTKCINASLRIDSTHPSG